ncbi:hypothetical protein Tco_1357837 [Tanacetum coccineum]
MKTKLSAKHQLAVKGLSECKASESNIRRIQVKDIVKEVEDYLKTYSSAGLDINCTGGSHVTNVPAFDKDDFTSWKIKFLVFLDALEPYLITTLVDGLFVPMSNLSTPANPLPKRQNQWSNAERPSDTRDTKITTLRLKFNAFKALEGEKVNGTYTRLKCLLNDHENNGVIISQSEDSDSDVEEDIRTSNEFMADLNAE